MKVIVTGSSGFIGQHIIKYFSEKNITMQEVSLRSSSWINKLDLNSDVLIHLAGIAHDTQNNISPNEYFAVNNDLTVQLYKEFITSEVKDFIFFSSVKAVADTVHGSLTEEQDQKVQSPFGQSKRKAEKTLMMELLPEGKRIIIIRPCMVHGPGNKGNLNLLYKIVEKGLPWPLAAYNNRRSFIGIDNLLFLLDEIIKNKNVPSGIYNFADDNPISTNELINLLSETQNKKIKQWKIPRFIISTIAKLGDILNLPLNSERLSKLTEDYVVSNQKIKSALKIDQLPLSTEEGLIKTINSFTK